jgi:hypothetical protein
LYNLLPAFHVPLAASAQIPSQNAFLMDAAFFKSPSLVFTPISRRAFTFELSYVERTNAFTSFPACTS